MQLVLEEKYGAASGAGLLKHLSMLSELHPTIFILRIRDAANTDFVFTCLPPEAVRFHADLPQAADILFCDGMHNFESGSFCHHMMLVPTAICAVPTGLFAMPGKTNEHFTDALLLYKEMCAEVIGIKAFGGRSVLGPSTSCAMTTNNSVRGSQFAGKH